MGKYIASRNSVMAMNGVRLRENNRRDSVEAHLKSELRQVKPKKMEAGFKHARKATLPLITTAASIVDRSDIKWVIVGGTWYYIGSIAGEKAARRLNNKMNDRLIAAARDADGEEAA